MKLYIKSIIAMAALLLTTSATAAETDEKFVISYQSDGVDCSEGVAGTVVGSVSGTTATLTVTPVDGYYITKKQIIVTKLVSGDNAQTRTSVADTPVEITATNVSADPSGVTTYTFDASDPNYRYEVKANFLSRKDIDDAQISLIEDAYFEYSGKTFEPAISVTYSNEDLTADKDYTVAYANNVNAGTADITITGKGVYKGTKTTHFDIHQADVTIWFEKADGSEPLNLSVTYGESFTEPVLKLNPANAIEVTYSVDKQNLATVDATTGKLTILKAGTVTVKAAAAKDYANEEGSNFNANPENTNSSYTLTIKKGTATLTFSKKTATATVGAAFEAPTLTKTPKTLAGVKFTSSNTNVATVDKTSGTVTLVGAGETTIKAAFAGSDTYEAAEASYKLTVNNAIVTNATMTVSATGFDGAYDGKAHGITVTVTTPAEGAVVKYGTTEGTYDLTKSPGYTNAGIYTVYYQVTKDGYETTTSNSKVVIRKATPTVTAPTAKENLTYTGEAQELINAGSTTGGKMLYSLDNDTYSTSIPTGTEAKEYTVYYKVVGGTNYNDIAAASLKVTIKKATPSVTPPTAKEGLTYTGEAQELINAGSTTGGKMLYSLDNDTYSTSIPTGTEAKEYIVYYKVVGNTNYEDVAAASLKVTIGKAPVESYPLWINDTQVTEDNAEDILGHDENPNIPLYIYNKKNNDHILIVNQDLLGTTVIKSGLPELQVYIIEANKLKSIEFHNQGAEGNTGKLTFTCNGNHPGRLVIANTKGNSAITGFSEINYKWKLTLTKPESAFYDETEHQMMYKDQNNVTQIADSVIIGQEIIPTYNQEIVSLRNPALKIAAINFKNYSYSPTADPTKSKILITLNPTPGDPEAGDDYIDDDGEPGIVVGSTMKDSQAGKVANLVATNELVPGGSKFAEDYDGFTFMVPAGSGTIIIDQEVEEGYEFHLRIGTGAPITLAGGDSGRAMAQESYDVTTPTYCYLYLVEKAEVSGTRGTRLGKRTKAHGKLIAIQVSATTIIPTTPPSEASGGIIPQSEDPEDPVTTPTGIREVKSGEVKSKYSNHWFTLDGQALQSKPTKAGIYIFNHKKVVIK